MDCDNMSKQNRKFEANQARLDAIRSKVEESELAQSQIKNDLFNPDKSKRSNTHIRFSDSDEDDCVKISKKDIQRKPGDVVLGFASRSDSESDEIFVKPQFQGSSGEKLLQLQSSYGNDARFKLDERFAEENDSSGRRNENQSGTVQNSNLKGEMTKNFEILSQVVGKTIKKTELKKRRGMKFVDTSEIRYDPDKTEHLVIQNKKSVDSLPVKKKRKKAKTEEVVVVDTKKYYKTSTDVLKEVFTSANEQPENEGSDELKKNKDKEKPFSILAMLGRVENSDQYEDMTGTLQIRAVAKEACNDGMKHDMPTLKRVFQYDSSDTDEDEDITNQKTTHAQPISVDARQYTPNTLFLSSPDDPRIVTGVEAFCLNKSFTETQKEWLLIKDTLIQDYKKKHRDAKRKAKIEAKLSVHKINSEMAVG